MVLLKYGKIINGCGFSAIIHLNHRCLHLFQKEDYPIGTTKTCFFYCSKHSFLKT